MDRHRGGSAQQAKPARPFRRLGSGGQRNQCSHRMPHQRGACTADRIEGVEQPSREIGDTLQRLATRSTMPGQIQSEYVPSVMRQIAGLVLPDRMVHACAVQEYHVRKGRVASTKTRVRSCPMGAWGL